MTYDLRKAHGKAMGKVIAICGKGGVGKTTVSAILACALSRGLASPEFWGQTPSAKLGLRGRGLTPRGLTPATTPAQALSTRKGLKVLLIDADPAGGLAMALGISAKRSLNQVRKDTIRAIKKGQRGKKEIAMSIDYLLMEALSEKGNLAFLSIGRPEEIGCFCPVNSLLRSAIEMLADNFDVTVIDAEAGIEQVNRKVMASVNNLVLVSDVSAKGIKVAETIKKVAKKVTGQDAIGLLINRARSEKEISQIRSHTKLNIIGSIPEDETIRKFDSNELSFLNLPPCPAYKAVVKAFENEKIL